MCRANSLNATNYAIGKFNKLFNLKGIIKPDNANLSFDGYVAAGSSVILSCTSHMQPNDIDFFLIGNNQKDAMKSYTKCLTDISNQFILFEMY